ncbi:MAG: hypothetical protein U1E05_12355 [Patescibacteria group bacterium]|nr:hypothetical protein [Patescibacteria group bacterium]
MPIDRPNLTRTIAATLVLVASAALTVARPVAAADGTSSPAITVQLEKDKMVAIAFGWLPKTTAEVTVTLTRPQGWYIVTPEEQAARMGELKEKSGNTIWHPHDDSFDENVHTWKGYGYEVAAPHDIVNAGTFVLFRGKLHRDGGTEGTRPEFAASVADVDIDVQCAWPHTGSHWPPAGTTEEDRVEADEPNGGMIVPQLIQGAFPEPGAIATQEPYMSAWKYVYLRLTMPWDSQLAGSGDRGRLRFTISGSGVALYYYDSPD